MARSTASKRVIDPDAKRRNAAAASPRTSSTISGGRLLDRAGVERRLRVVLDAELDRLRHLGAARSWRPA